MPDATADDGADLAQLRCQLADALNRIQSLEDNQRGMLAFIRVLDRLRPTCVLCHDETADRQTARGPACSDCVGDVPDDGADLSFPESWAFAEVQEGQADEPEHGPAAAEAPEVNR
jgi:hypothetical protein